MQVSPHIFSSPFNLSCYFIHLLNKSKAPRKHERIQSLLLLLLALLDFLSSIWRTSAFSSCASMAAAASLSLLPSSSLSFIPDRPHTLVSPPTSSLSSSSFSSGATHKSLISLYSSFSKLNPRLNRAKRGFGPVITASGDYYATLGVPKSASSKEIKAAYRRLARQVPISFGRFSILSTRLRCWKSCAKLSSEFWVLSIFS